MKTLHIIAGYEPIKHTNRLKEIYMGYANCPMCGASNFIEADIIFDRPVFYFLCRDCDNLFGETPDGTWAESGSTVEWLKDRDSSYNKIKSSGKTKNR